MNASDRLAQLLALTREPFPASKKIHLPGSVHGNLRVPMRELVSGTVETRTLCDTSGPYTDPTADIDLRRGLPDLRSPWIEARGDTVKRIRRARSKRSTTVARTAAMKICASHHCAPKLPPCNARRAVPRPVTP